MSIDDPNALQGNGTGAPKLQAQAGHDLGEATNKAKQDLDAIAQRAKEDARNLGHQAEEKIAEVTDTAKSFAADQKDLAAGQINGIAAAITKVADELDNSDQQTVARYARDLANGISSMGKTIEDRDVDDLMGLAQDFGRKQPVAFLGAAALAGFVASRFALASSNRRDNKASTSSSGSYQPTGSSTYGGYQSTDSSSPSSGYQSASSPSGSFQAAGSSSAYGSTQSPINEGDA